MSIANINIKYILVSLLFVNSLFSFESEFVEPDKAFVVTSHQETSKTVITMTLYKDIYVYKDKLKVLVGKDDITSKLVFPKPSIEHDEKVFYGLLNIEIPNSLIKDKIILKFQGCSAAGICYAPMENIFTFEIKENKTNQSDKITVATTKKVTTQPKNEIDTIAQTLKSGNIFLTLVTFFGFGLLLALTPCIFPMIPILSSIIVQQSKSQDGKMSSSQGLFLSIVYVLSMSFAYTLAGVLAGLFGANLQVALQNPYVIVAFSTIFVALALSMFGYYEIGLPVSWQSRLNKTSEENSKKGGIVGVAIMGFLSALIVGPCVAPPLAGALVYIGQTGDALLGGTALFVMSLGMGLPLLAIGFGAGKYMPQPGGWMNMVSKIFGIVMLTIALWMLERIISATLFIYLSSILLVGTALYLKVFDNLIARIITTFIFIYGVMLFIGAISGATNVIDPLEKLKGNVGSIVKQEELNFKQIKTVAQLDEVLKNTNKPVMLDFWATWCVSCKELDVLTFTNKEVRDELSKYTLLRVDMTNNNNDDKVLQKKFNLFGPPALIFFDKNGKEIEPKKIIGFKSPEEFLKIVK